MGLALRQRGNGPVESLPLNGRDPYEAARDAARDATGLAKIQWGRGKGVTGPEYNRDGHTWDYVVAGDTTFIWIT